MLLNSRIFNKQLIICIVGLNYTMPKTTQRIKESIYFTLRSSTYSDLNFRCRRHTVSFLQLLVQCCHLLLVANGRLVYRRLNLTGHGIHRRRLMWRPNVRRSRHYRLLLLHRSTNHIFYFTGCVLHTVIVTGGRRNHVASYRI